MTACLDLDIKIIGEAFVSSPTMGVEWQQHDNDEGAALPKKYYQRNGQGSLEKFTKVKNLWSRYIK